MATPVMGQFDTPAKTGQSAGAQALQGKLETDNASGNLQGQAQTAKKAPTVLVGKTSSTALQGGIHASGAVLPAFKLHMTQDQLKSAVDQYTADLQQFYLHAKDYHLTQEALKKQIGECTENQQQWEATLAKDRLQLGTVVIATGVPNMPPPPPTPPTIAPPRICCVGCLITGRCGHLGTAGGGGGGGAPQSNTFNRSDAMRMQEANADLQKAQNNLRFSEKENAFTSQNAINEAQIEQSQQGLAEKFGRLQQEFDTLKIEKEAFDRRQSQIGEGFMSDQSDHFDKSGKADRRTILKAMAALPVAITFGPLDYFKRQKALRLISDPAPSFIKGACVKFDATTFTVPMKVMPFSVDIGDDQKVDSFAVKLPDGRVVAYPSSCPKLDCQIKLKESSDEHGAPILYCDCHNSVFDLNTGDVLQGPERANLRPFKVKDCKQRICVIIEDNYLPEFMT